MKKNKLRDTFLEQLRKIPIVQVACEKVGLSRNTVYRWKREDKEFEKDMDEALAEGEALINDMSESQLLTMIKEKNWSAVSFWLRHRNPKFRDRIEVTTKIKDESLTPEQETAVREALRLATVGSKDITNSNQTNYEQQSTNPTGISGHNDKGPESPNSNN